MCALCQHAVGHPHIFSICPVHNWMNLIHSIRVISLYVFLNREFIILCRATNNYKLRRMSSLYEVVGSPF